MSGERVFLLDQDFPLLLTGPKYWPDVNIRPLREVHPDLIADHEDWEVLHQLRVRGGVDGFITLDTGMLNLPREMVVLQQTKLKLVVVEEGGNDPLVATGLLMAYMPQILKRFDRRRAQLWIIRPGERTPIRPWDQLRRIAEHRNEDPADLLRANRLPWSELR